MDTAALGLRIQAEGFWSGNGHGLHETKFRLCVEAQPACTESRSTLGTQEVHEVKARHLGTSAPTGSFGAFRPAPLVGVSDDVRLSTRKLVKAARRAERDWLKTLPKGVTV